MLVSVTGKMEAFQIRVGNKSSEVGDRGEVRENALCHFSLAINTRVPRSMQFDCGYPLIGRYVSIENVEPIVITQMKLCHVDVLYR